jgi:hypothetical protein
MGENCATVFAVADEGGGRRLVARWRWGRMWPGSWRGPGAYSWEKVLRGERSSAFRLARFLASVPGVRRALGLSPRLADADDRSFEAREARVADVNASLIGRLARRRGRADPSLPMDVVADRPADFPRIGALLDREVDAALEILRAVPLEELQRRGWNLIPNTFATPVNDLRFLRAHPELWIREQVPAEVDWNLDGQLELLENLHPYSRELTGVRDGPPAGPGEFVWNNPSIPAGDAAAYYGIVRHLQPRRVIEVGAGWSTLVLERAIEANQLACEVTVIEPDPGWQVLGEVTQGWNLDERPVQLADLAQFETLEPGDVLFYDGSHVVRTASDVNWIFFEVLPRLAPGVWIHVHDLMWPSDYPPMWVLDNGLSWNEQYFVQAFLMGNSLYRVRLAVNLLSVLRPTEVAALLPNGAGGGSLWIEKVGRAEG